MPFLAFTIIQTAGSHFVSGKGESSKIVPTLAVNCFLQDLQLLTNRFARKATNLIGTTMWAKHFATPAHTYHEIVALLWCGK